MVRVWEAIETGRPAGETKSKADYLVMVNLVEAFESFELHEAACLFGMNRGLMTICDYRRSPRIFGVFAVVTVGRY